MASLYKRNNVWWIKYRASTGKIIQKSTGLLVSVPEQSRQARDILAQKTFDESKSSPIDRHERWPCWVRAFLESRYSNSASSLLRYTTAWRTISMFLDERGIKLPRQLTRDHCIEYIEWRKNPDASYGKYRAGHNTAHLEIKTLSMVMAEAVIRNYAPFNPCRELHIRRQRTRLKPELDQSDFDAIEAAIAVKPEPIRTFFQRSYLLARYHGCRLSETLLNPMESVTIAPDSLSGTITFRVKGGGEHTVQLHPKLVPMFTDLRRLNITATYTRPASPAKEWHNLLKKCGVKARKPGACFHSLRVTVATRLARSGISERKAMRYIGHASETVHRSYVRLRPEDVSDCADALDG